ncbi:LysR family transcriptional regulator [Kineococcus rubinsiae]|uniref:LysR family transcriptional regulator n=1 Tax=Kineococcus rubinsiae TaxID=2609562 RepID=UPI001431F191|nr:LysR family transcriptional regulator [Kineococcus rubinsiae]NIZ91772.1 LysR family transcriptional regulator [Kineococcus rubinsiae]
MDVSTPALRCFVTLHEELHFGRAAQRLHVTTPSLSEQIARLEKRLGVPLFTRTSRSVRPTPAAAELLPLARAVLEAHEAVVGWAAARGGDASGPVRVGVVAAAGADVRAAVRPVVEARPGLVVGTRRLAFLEEAAALREGRIDVAFAPAPLPRPATGIRAVAVSRTPRVLVVPAGHRLAGRASVSVEETNDEVFLTVVTDDPATTGWWLVDPRADGSSPRRRPVVTDVEEVLDRCAAGEGLNIASAEVAQHYVRPGVVFVPLDDVEDATVLLCWRAQESDPAVLEYVAAVRDAAAAG